jgi:hypothetical protein
MEKTWQALHNVASWHVRSAERSRQNAMVAATALAALRAERDDAEAFLERHLAAKARTADARTA